MLIVKPLILYWNWNDWKIFEWYVLFRYLFYPEIIPFILLSQTEVFFLCGILLTSVLLRLSKSIISPPIQIKKQNTQKTFKLIFEYFKERMQCVPLPILNIQLPIKSDYFSFENWNINGWQRYLCVRVFQSDIQPYTFNRVSIFT